MGKVFERSLQAELFLLGGMKEQKEDGVSSLRKGFGGKVLLDIYDCYERIQALWLQEFASVSLEQGVWESIADTSERRGLHYIHPWPSFFCSGESLAGSDMDSICISAGPLEHCSSPPILADIGVLSKNTFAKSGSDATVRMKCGVSGTRWTC
jgi:hypothetical protein